MRFLIAAILCALAAIGLIFLQNSLITSDKQASVDIALTQGVLTGQGQPEYVVEATVSKCTDGPGWSKTILLEDGGNYYFWCTDNGASGKYKSLVGKWHIYKSPDGVKWSRW